MRIDRHAGGDTGRRITRIQKYSDLSFVQSEQKRRRFDQMFSRLLFKLYQDSVRNTSTQMSRMLRSFWRQRLSSIIFIQLNTKISFGNFLKIKFIIIITFVSNNTRLCGEFFARFFTKLVVFFYRIIISA